MAPGAPARGGLPWTREACLRRLGLDPDASHSPEAVSAASPDSILAGPERVEKENKEPEASVAKLETAFESATIAPAAEKKEEPAAPALFAGFRNPSNQSWA